MCYYINYYFILYRIILELELKDETNNPFNLKVCLKYGIQMLTHLKTYFEDKKMLYINAASEQKEFSNNFIILIGSFNNLKGLINKIVNINLDIINKKYEEICIGKYQNYIPKNCDGIWIKPSFDLTILCNDPLATQAPASILGGNKRLRKKGGVCDGSNITDDVLRTSITNCTFPTDDNLIKDNIFKNLNMTF